MDLIKLMVVALAGWINQQQEAYATRAANNQELGSKKQQIGAEFELPAKATGRGSSILRSVAANGFEIPQSTQRQGLPHLEKQRVLMTAGALGEPNEPLIRNPRSGVLHLQEAGNPLISKGLRAGGVGEC